MSKKIDTLVKDIKESFLGAIGKTTTPQLPEMAVELGVNIGEKLVDKLKPSEAKDRFAEKKIYSSELGSKCMRKVWYKFRPHEVKPELPDASAQIKFTYGDILEDLVLFLAKLAGHKVEHRQRRVTVPLVDGWCISGKIDATIDGELVDVKSCSSYSFQKIREGLKDDAFGYKEQLASYAMDAMLVPGNRAFILPIDKTLGHIDLVEFAVPRLPDPIIAGEEIVNAVVQVETPTRGFTSIKDKYGNEKLDVECSYCPFKKDCWPGLRTFITGKGPIHYVRLASAATHTLGYEVKAS